MCSIPACADADAHVRHEYPLRPSELPYVTLFPLSTRIMIPAEEGLMAEEKWLYKGRLISVERVDTPAGEREVVRHPGAVAIVVRDGEGQVLLVRQYRAPAGREMWEIPAGTVEPGERPLATAKRELLEETGVSAGTWSFLGTVFLTPGYSDERIHLYLAEGISGEVRGSTEVAEARFFSARQILDLVQDGLGDGKTLAALALLG